MAGSDTGSVERSFFTTSVVDRRHRFDFFAEQARLNFSRREYKNISESNDYLADVNVMQSGESKCFLWSGPPHEVMNNSYGISHGDRKHFFFSFILNGEAEYEGLFGKRVLRTGSSTVTDNVSAHRVRWRPNKGTCRSITIQLRHDKFISSMALERLADERIMSSHKFAVLLKMSLRNLAASVIGQTDREVVELLKIAETLVWLIAEDGKLDNVRNGNTTLSAIEMEINSRLLCPDLSLSRISSTLNVSTRNIQRTMASMDTTFSEYVRNKRLSMAVSHLRRPKVNPPSIESISLACGFSDLSTFYRAFKARYGCTPGDIRNEVETLERKDRQAGAV